MSYTDIVLRGHHDDPEVIAAAMEPLDDFTRTLRVSGAAALALLALIGRGAWFHGAIPAARWHRLCELVLARHGCTDRHFCTYRGSPHPQPTVRVSEILSPAFPISSDKPGTVHDMSRISAVSAPVGSTPYVGS